MPFVRQLTQRNGFTLSVVRTKRTFDALRVLTDQAVCSFHDMSRRPVVRFELDDRSVWIVLLKTEDIANIGLSPGVYRLVRVTDHKEILESVRKRRDQN